MKPITECYLYGFIDTAYLGGRSAADLTACLCDNGVDLLQLRAKGLEMGQVWTLAEQVKSATDRFDVPLVINDYPTVALQIGAAFCHLGQEDLPLNGVQDAGFHGFDPTGRCRLGVSTHTPEQAISSMTIGAAYLGVGPVYPTGTKPQAKAVTLEYVRWASNNVAIPWFAIGGISLSNVDQVIEAGAKRICVVSAILNAPDPARACKSFRDRLASPA